MPEFKPTRLVEITRLELDSKNPRLPSRLQGKEEEAIIEYLAMRENVVDLIASIGTNGFFPSEAVVVTKSESTSDEGESTSDEGESTDGKGESTGAESESTGGKGESADGKGESTDDKYVVLEGNRRLVALKLLQDETLAKKIAINLGEAVRRAANRPTMVPVYEVDNRGDALQYLGFRHVSGVQRWDPLAKARYLKLLYQEAEGDPEARYTQIAREIGSRSNMVRRNLDAIAVYDTIAEDDFYSIPDLREETFQFGTFYTALSNMRIAEFAGTRDEDGNPNHPIENPDTIDRAKVADLTRWIFQKLPDGTTKLGESRNIGMLGDVVADEHALKRFREGLTLREAHQETPGTQNEFVAAIREAIEKVEYATERLGSVSQEDPEVQQAALDLLSKTNEIVEALGLSDDVLP